MKKTNYILLLIKWIFALLVVAPLLYALSLSFMRPEEIFSNPRVWIPGTGYLDNYKQALNGAPLFTFIRNSFIVSAVVTVGQICVCSLAAFAFSYFPMKGKKLLFILVLATMMIPGESTIIANYMTISSWNWMDTFTGLTVPFLTSAMGIFLMRQSFLTIPKELYEAAKMDGCGNFRFFTNILLPLSRPAVASLGVYTFLSTWNQYMWPLLITNRDEMRTVQIGIGMLQNAESQSYGVIMAGIVLVLIPSIFIFIIFQKQLVSGITTGSVKG
ncbi:carbohydrate ABC transporter permease [Ectobacillus antri]|jgi:sn-glycerol 3-phosphate transport system permease protein|uniref:Carbohydrate ABC transporter permease n=1 Tax=Ectobacillus antri TaxID=2486280 RepID=A0ABT6H7S8_9BACI|nr:carbohydrate ABC transporter permease [Ectobacillus antri]MDG4657670.1 carbohydrate ABC transporter permease [Ectobacillus antri]MDG5754677.1 carbohydrate ABC transporter permease [Ectobacillus antri]